MNAAQSVARVVSHAPWQVQHRGLRSAVGALCISREQVHTAAVHAPTAEAHDVVADDAAAVNVPSDVAATAPAPVPAPARTADSTSESEGPGNSRR